MFVKRIVWGVPPFAGGSYNWQKDRDQIVQLEKEIFFLKEILYTLCDLSIFYEMPIRYKLTEILNGFEIANERYLEIVDLLYETPKQKEIKMVLPINDKNPEFSKSMRQVFNGLNFLAAVFLQEQTRPVVKDILETVKENCQGVTMEMLKQDIKVALQFLSSVNESQMEVADKKYIEYFTKTYTVDNDLWSDWVI